MNHPIAAATMATIVPARNALTMKWNASALRTSSTTFQVSLTSAPVESTPASVSMAVQIGVVRRGLGVTDDHQPSVGSMEHLDRRAVEAAQRLGRDHRARITRRGTAACEVHDQIEEAEDRIHVVRDDDHGHLL